MGVSLLSNTRTAEATAAIQNWVFPAVTNPTMANITLNIAAIADAAATASTATSGGTGTSTARVLIPTTGAAGTAATTFLVLTESATAQITAGTLSMALPSGFQFTTTGTCAVANAGGGASTMTCLPSINAAATTLTLTIAGGSTTGLNTITMAGTAIRATSNTAAAGNILVVNTTTATTTLSASGGYTGHTVTPIAILPAGTIIGTVAAPTAGAYATTTVAPYITSLVSVANATACGLANPVTNVTAAALAASFPADGSITRNLCATVHGADGGPVSSAMVTFTVTTGFIGTGTARTAIAVTNAAGNANVTYRGGGGFAGVDTAIASSTALNTVGTLALTLTAPAGGTATKVVVGSAQHLAIAATLTTPPGYIAPQVGTTTYVQVQDTAGLGVDGQVVLISVDRGAVVDGIAASCVVTPGTAKSFSATTFLEAQVAGGSTVAGTIAFTVCSNQSDAAGKITITAQNISTAMTLATSSISTAGRPAKIEATAAGSMVTATVTDTAGNKVSDGTPVRFTISSAAGAVSSACSPTNNGVATTVVALIGATGTIIVSTDWNETGSAVPGCAAVTATSYVNTVTVSSGSQQLAIAVAVPGGTAPAAAPAAGAGTFSGTPIAAAGITIVSFTGTIAQLGTAGTTAKVVSVTATVAGKMITYVVGGPEFVNAGFTAAFPAGLAATGVIVKTGA